MLGIILRHDEWSITRKPSVVILKNIDTVNIEPTNTPTALKNP